MTNMLRCTHCQVNLKYKKYIRIDNEHRFCCTGCESVYLRLQAEKKNIKEKKPSKISRLFKKIVQRFHRK